MTNPNDPNNPNEQNPQQQGPFSGQWGQPPQQPQQPPQQPQQPPQQPQQPPQDQNQGNPQQYPPVGQQYPGYENQAPGFQQNPYPIQEKKKRPKALIAVGSSVAVIGVIGICVVSAFAYKAFTGNTSGASKPEGVITNTFASLEKQDLLGAAKNMDPSEMGQFVENYSTFMDALERNDDILDKDKPLESFTFKATDVKTKTVEYSDDVARVEMLSGVITSKTDNTKLPNADENSDEGTTETFDIADANKSWREGIASDLTQSYAQGFGVNPGDTEFDKSKLESDNVFYIAVKRDGRWYLSSLYTTIEYGRILANASGADIARPNFDASLRIGDGADTPEKAVEAMIENIFSKDAISKIFPPERLSVIYDYKGTKDKANVETFDVDFITKALEDSLTVESIKTSSRDDGKNRQFVTINSLKFNFLFEPDLENTTSPLAPYLPEIVDADVNFDGKCVAYDGFYRYNFGAFGSPELDSLFTTDETYDSYDFSYDSDFDYQDVNFTGSTKQASAKSSNRPVEGTNETFSGKECLSDTAIDEVGVTTIKEDGKYYFSPIDTIWHYVIKAVKEN